MLLECDDHAMASGHAMTSEHAVKSEHVVAHRAAGFSLREASRRLKPAAQKNLLRRTDVTEHELDGELLIFDPVTSDTHRLYDTALFIWQSCDGTRDVGQVASALAAAYDVSADEAHGHVERLLNELSDKGLFA